MMVTILEIILSLAGIYLVLGLLAALALHVRGLGLIDPGVDPRGQWGFRLLITPGLVTLWPLMLRRWHLAVNGRPHQGEPDAPVASAGLRQRHRRLALLMLVAIPLIAGAAVLSRPDLPRSRAADDLRSMMATTSPIGTIIDTWEQAFEPLSIEVTLRRGPSAGLQLELKAAEDLAVPGLVAFWSDSMPRGAPGAGTFLGGVWGPDTRRFALPARAADGGFVILYSMGHREVVGSLQIESLRERSTS